MDREDATQASFPSGEHRAVPAARCFSSSPSIRGGQGRRAPELIGSAWVVLACAVALGLVLIGAWIG